MFLKCPFSEWGNYDPQGCSRRPGSYSRILPLHSCLEYVLKSGHVSHAPLGMNWRRYRLTILEEVNTPHKGYQHVTGANFPPVGEIVKPRAASAPGCGCENQWMPIKVALACVRLNPNGLETTSHRHPSCLKPCSVIRWLCPQNTFTEDLLNAQHHACIQDREVKIRLLPEIQEEVWADSFLGLECSQFKEILRISWSWFWQKPVFLLTCTVIKAVSYDTHTFNIQESHLGNAGGLRSDFPQFGWNTYLLFGYHV